MGTLDEKYLDGPNVGYCSDSDEEEPQQSSGPSNPPPSGRAGAKGVLDDYKAFKGKNYLFFIIFKLVIFE